MSREVSSGTSGKRAWLAVVLSFLVPGIGHLYLREWIRSVFWFLTVVLAGNLLIPPSAVSSEFSLQAITDMFDAAPLEAKVALVGLTFLCMADAYWVAKREQPLRQARTDGQTCPNCGKDVDEDLDFCHWCSADLSGPEDDDETLTAGEVHERSGELGGDLTGGPDVNDDIRDDLQDDVRDDDVRDDDVRDDDLRDDDRE